MQRYFLVIFLLFTSLRSVFATDYYVDQNHPSASDSNPGTEALPFLSIQAGVNTAQAGDNVIIKGDTDSSSTLAIYNVSRNGITTVRDGSNNNNIIIKAYNDHTVIIKGDGTGDGIELNNSYHEFHGIIFSGFNKATEGSASKMSILIENCEFTDTKETGLRLRNIDGLTIRDTYIHHCFESGVSLRGCNNVLFERVESSYNSDGKGSSGDGDGFHSLDGDNVDFINCIAIGNSEDGFDITSNGKMVNCISANHTACNVKLWRRDGDGYVPKTMKIVNSLIYGAGECGIKISNGAQLLLFNNVIYNNGEDGAAFRGISISEGPAVVTSYLVNNIIVASNKTANWAKTIDVRQSGSNVNKVIANYNLYDGYQNTSSGVDMDDNFILDDPQFINAADADFHLELSSPAIDKGISQEVYNSLYDSLGVDISLDFDGNGRPQNSIWDIGAFESQTTTSLQQNSNGLPSSYTLQNYPNPFNPSTKVEFELSKGSHAKLEIFNISGQKILTLVDNYFNAGKYFRDWNGKNSQNKSVGSGVYYYRLVADGQVLTKKMILLR